MPFRKAPFRIAMLGPQGSGKGTQGDLLAAAFGIPIISTGELFRQQAATRTLLGEQIASYINQGKLVPDEITNTLVEQRLAAADCVAGFIIDGFPRTMGQAMVAEQLFTFTQVVLIHIDDHEALRRISGRLRCANCGAGYNATARPPKKAGVCDHCSGPLSPRRDDMENVALQRRLNTYREQSTPILEYYQQQGSLITIDGKQPIEAVQRDIRAAIDKKSL